MLTEVPRTELVATHELLRPQPIYGAVAHLHTYNPQRHFVIELGSRTITVFNYMGKDAANHTQGWNGRITDESYNPLAKQGYFNHPLISWNLNGVTADWLAINRPEVLETIQGQIEASGLKPVGDTYEHVIMPHLSENWQRLFLRMGTAAYGERWQTKPDLIWLPEMAVNNQTLLSIAKENIQGVLLRDYQIESPDIAPAYTIDTGAGLVTAITTAQHTSGSLGFDRPFADSFTEQIAQECLQTGRLPRIAIDAETLGHHWESEKGVWDFTNHFFNRFVPAYIKTHVFDPRIQAEDLRAGRLRENTSWSCLEAGIGRWEGANNCNCDLPEDPGVADAVRMVKRDLFQKTQVATRRLEEFLNASHLKQDTTGFPEWMNEYIAWFLAKREYIVAAKPLKTSRVSEQSSLEEWFPIIAILQKSLVSCGNFFGSPQSVEREGARNALTAFSLLTGWPDLTPI